MKTISKILFALLACATFNSQAAENNAPINIADYKPPIRVACLGDSITHGVGAATGWAWPDQLDRMLGEKWDVRNFGHSGATVGRDDKHSIWNQQEYKNALLFHPDVAIILLGTNDTKPENWAKKQDFSKVYKDLVTSFQKLSSKPRVFAGTAPYVAKKGAFGINEAGVKEQIPMIRQVASDWGAGVIDVHGATENRDDVFKDNVHPSTEGATLIARAVYQALTGQEWQGAIPSPLEVRKSKPGIRVVDDPGALTYSEVFTLIATAGMPPEKLAPLQQKFEESAPIVEAKIQELEDRIQEYDGLRMKYKHTTIEVEKPLYGEYKGKTGQTKLELAKFKNNANMELLALLPAEFKGAFGAAWVQRYVFDRLMPIALTITPEQRRQIRAICHKVGPAYGAITNTPERSIENVETYKTVYREVLEAEQKKRVDAQ